MQELTPVEKALVEILVKLNLEKETIMGMMLMLKDNKTGQNALLDFLKNTQYQKLTETSILSKVKEIITKEN